MTHRGPFQPLPFCDTDFVRIVTSDVHIISEFLSRQYYEIEIHTFYENEITYLAFCSLG